MSIVSTWNGMKSIHKICLLIVGAIIVTCCCYYGYYKYMQSKIKFKPIVGFSVEVNTKDLKAVGEKWLEAYTQQYRQRYVSRSLKLKQYKIDTIDIKQNNVIQIDFTIITQKTNSGTSAYWNGELEDGKVKCQWVLWFDEKDSSKGTYNYKVIKNQRPAAYDLEKYQTSGQKEKDEYNEKYKNEIPYDGQQYSYKIQKGVCYVTYDKGASWKEVPIDLNTLVEVGDGNTFYNKLQEKSYVINKQKTAFIYGGTRKNSLNITYSEDMGKTWNTAEISSKYEGTRIRFCNFITDNIGYVVISTDRTMSQEAQVIFKTNDKGATWKEVGGGPSGWLLYSAGFVDENIGFMSYPKVEGDSTNFYRTEDGGKTFQPIILPVVKQEWMGNTFEPFIQPEAPYVENGELYVLVGQGEQGDFKGGKVMAKYKSTDKGKTWSFVELIEPPTKEIG